MPDSYKVLVDCFDANGLYEENYERIMLVMNCLASSKLLKRDWVSSQAVGGTWARSIRCTFQAELDAYAIKALMLGLEYASLDEVPERLHPKSNSELFRFADIDVFEIKGKEGSAVSRIAGRLRLSERKIGIGDLRKGESDVKFALSCRKKLLEQLDDGTRKELLDLENQIYEVLQRAVL
ncbi:MAG: hypothetical protein ACE5H4_11040 [Candidatus Thorarchaeota archaeon]